MSRREEHELVAQVVAGRRPAPSGWVRANCPLCELRDGKADRKSALGYQVRSRKFHCFKCGAVGRLDASPDEYDLDALDDEEQREFIDPPEGFCRLVDEPAASALVFEPAWEYLLRPVARGGRGMTEDLIDAAGVGVVPAGDFAGRVIVPVTDAQGRWQWYVGRAWTKKAWLPYRYPSGGRPSQLLYNAIQLTRESEEPVLVVEGVFDALAHWPNSVATLGKTTDQLVEQLKHARRPVALVPDGDAWEEGWAVRMRLALAGVDAGLVKLPPRVDPDEIPASMLRDAAWASIGKLAPVDVRP